MIRIDLGKASRKQGEAIRKVATQLKLQQPYDELLSKFDNDVSRMVAFLVSIAVAILPYLFVTEYSRVVTKNFEAKMRNVDKEIAAVEVEIQGLLPFKKELESYEAQRAQVNQRLSVIQSLIDTRGTPVTTLDAIGQALPEGVWLENVSFESGGAQGKIIVAGKAISNEDISDFVDRLSQSAYLKGVRITSVEAATFNGFEIKNFGIDLEASSQAVQAPGAGTIVTPVREIGGKK